MNQRLKRGAVRALFDTLMVFGLLLGGLFCFLDLIPLEIDKGSLLRLAVPPIFLLLLAYWQPKRRGLWVGLFMGTFALVVFLLRKQLINGAVAVGCALSQVYAQNLPGAVPLYPLRVLTPEEIARGSLVFLAVMLLFFAFIICWTVARRHSFWYSFISTLPMLFGSVLIMRTPPLVPMLTLLACWLTLALASGAGRRGLYEGAKAGLLVLPLVASLMALVLAVAPPEKYQRSPQVESLRMWLYGLAAGGGNDAPGVTPFSQANGESELSQAGNLRFLGETALSVYSQQPEKMYLKGFSAERYTGSKWKKSPMEEYENALGDLVFSPLTLTSDVMRGSNPQQQPFALTVELVRPNGAYLYTPYGLAGLEGDLENIIIMRDSYVRVPRKQQSYPMTAMSLSNVASPLLVPESLRQAESRYRSFVDATCLEIEPQLAQYLRRLAAQQGIQYGEDADWKDIVDGVAEYIRSAAQYDAAPGLTPRGEDYVQYFLEENKRGYCMHFASAGVMMLRALGVPARYVEGYLVPAESFDDQGNALVEDTQAHAWAEVYVDGVGWLPVEMTPGYGGVSIETTVPPVEAPEEEAQPQLPQEQPELPQEQPEEELSPEIIQQQEEAAQQRARRNLFWWLLPLPVLALLLVLRAWCLNLLRQWRFARGEYNRRALAIYAYCQKLPAILQRDPCLEQLAYKAKFSPHQLTQQELEQMLLAMQDLQAKVRERIVPRQRLWLRYIRGLL